MEVKELISLNFVDGRTSKRVLKTNALCMHAGLFDRCLRGDALFSAVNGNLGHFQSECVVLPFCRGLFLIPLDKCLPLHCHAFVFIGNSCSAQPAASQGKCVIRLDRVHFF